MTLEYANVRFHHAKFHVHFAPLIKAAKGEKVEVDGLRYAFIGTMDMAISRIAPYNQASDAFKRAKDMVNLPPDSLE